MAKSKPSQRKSLMKRWHRLRQQPHFNDIVIAVVAGAFVVAGLIIFHSRAGIPNTAVTTSTGTISCPAVKVTDSTATGGSAVRFGSGTCTAPPQPTVESPHNGDTVPQAVNTMAIGVANYVAGQKVEGFVNGTLVGVGDNSNCFGFWCVQYDASKFAPGTKISLTGVTFDANGKQYTSAAITVTIANPAASNGARLGIATGAPYLPAGLSDAAYMNKIKQIGGGWVRTDAQMSNYPSTTFIDGTLQDAKNAGLKVLVTLTYTWSANGGYQSNPSNHQAWATYAGQLVDHWNQKFPGLIGAYEIWNEANGSFWHPTGSNSGNAGVAAYTDLLKKAYVTLHPKVGSAPILTTGTAPQDGNGPADTTNHPQSPASWVQGIYNNNGGSSAGAFDAVAHHPYQTNINSNFNGAGGGYRATAYIRAVMNAHNDSARKIWGTEAGWPSCTATPWGDIMNESQRDSRFHSDMKDWFYGLHNSDGSSKGQYSTTGDWNTAAWMIYKLYKNYNNSNTDPTFGLIYDSSGHTCSGMTTPAAWFEPPIVTSFKNFAASSQTTIGP